MSAATDSGEDAAHAETGGVPAEAAPPEGALPQGDERPTRPCANCGHPRQDRFCPKCGQNDRDYVRSLPPLLGDILKETFELDSRIRRTLPPLFLRPGELPAEFSRNRRARYMSSVRLYLFTSIVFFFLLSTLSDFRPRQLDREAVQERGAEAVRIDIEEARTVNTDALKALLPRPQQREVDEIIARPGMVFAKGMIVGLATHIEENPEDYESAMRRFVLARLIDAAGDPGDVISQFVENLPLAMFITLPAYALLLMFFFFGSHRFFTEHLVFAVQLHTFAFIVLAVSMLLPEDVLDRQAEHRADNSTVAQAFVDDAPAPDPVIRIRVGADADVQAGDSADEDANRPELRELRQRLRPDDDSWDVFDVIDLLLFLWLLVYHYLALRRYYGNGRLRTAIKWAVLTSAYCVLLIPGMALSAAFTVFQLR